VARALSELVRHVGRTAARGGLAHLGDAELLGRFAADRDPLAFEAIVWRHGAMVLGVCGRVLGRGADAEDAFQATFLALVRHARAVRSGGSLAGWLYRVARRVSTRAARGRLARAGRERLAARPEAVRDDEAERSDWRGRLDREVERLPARYREAFILCHVEGRAHEDAARELGCPLGTLHSRLARAKERLRGRLAGLGTALPVPARLVTATVAAAVGLAGGSVVAASPAAVALSQGVWKPMAMIKAKFLAAALAVAAAGSGAGLLWQPAATATPAPAAPRGEPTVEELKRENERLRREVATLQARLGELGRRSGDDAPSDREVLRAMSRGPRDVPYVHETFRDDIVITKVKVLDRLDPPRHYPGVGVARLRHQHWECTVYYTETVETAWPFPARVKTARAQVVYIDKDALVP
jgi:RNA polymerase sigma factor (sigma-70 family)